jgi:hypothetical protein
VLFPGLVLHHASRKRDFLGNRLTPPRTLKKGAQRLAGGCRAAATTGECHIAIRTVGKCHPTAYGNPGKMRAFSAETTAELKNPGFDAKDDAAQDVTTASEIRCNSCILILTY